MTTTNQILTSFIADVKPTQSFWALQDKESEDWVVLDSVNFDETEVMPLWSTPELALVHCTEEWSEYVPAEITLVDWLEFWVKDLVEDDVIIGLNWTGDDADIEVDLQEFTEALVEIEAL
ncbi:MAG: DUF2750 domain-containing protein [Psychromonas sp.]